jgi:hypothetical protein
MEIIYIGKIGIIGIPIISLNRDKAGTLPVGKMSIYGPWADKSFFPQRLPFQAIFALASIAHSDP